MAGLLYNDWNPDLDSSQDTGSAGMLRGLLGGPFAMDRRSALNQALMQAGATMLASGSPRFGQALGMGALQGVGAYGNALRQGQDERLGRLKLQMSLEDILQKQRQQQEQRKAYETYIAGLPPDQQSTAAIAPDEFAKAQIGKMFREPEKPMLVETADQKDPLRTVKRWLRPGEVEGPVVGMGTMPEILDPRVQAARERAARAGAPQVNVGFPQETFKNEGALRKEYNEAVAGPRKFFEAYDVIKGSLMGDITAPSTLAAATKFMKLLDAESVVRETELKMALDSTGLMDRFLNLHNIVLSGKVLTPSQAAEIQRIADVLANAQSSRVSKIIDQYRGLAKDYQLNPERVVSEVGSVYGQKSSGLNDDLRNAAREELMRRRGQR